MVAHAFFSLYFLYFCSAMHWIGVLFLCFFSTSWSQTVSIDPSDTVVCYKDTLWLSAQLTGGDSVAWSPTPDSTWGPFNDSAYYIIGTSNFQIIVTAWNNTIQGNQDTLDVFVVYPSVSVNPDTATICFGDTVYLNPSGAVTYLWLPDSVVQGLFPVSPPDTTYYQVVPISGNCMGDTLIVPVYVIPEPDVQIDYSQTYGCTGSPITIRYAGRDSDVVNITWSFQNGVPSAAVGKGPHSVTWFNDGVWGIVCQANNNGCIKTFIDSFIVYITPIVSAGNDVNLCSGDSVTLQGSVTNGAIGCVYQWSPFIHLTNPFASDPKAFPPDTMTYYLQAICNGCPSNIDSVNIFVLPSPTLTPDSTIVDFCAGSGGEVISVTASGGTPPYTYQWFPTIGLSSTNIPNPVANPPDDIVYKAVVIDQNGCTSDSAEIQVVVYALPIADVGNDVYLCKDGPGVYLNPTIIDPEGGPHSYLWVPGTGLSDSTVKNPYARPDTTTIYYLIVTNLATGCTSDPTTLDSISYLTVHVTPRPTADAGPDSVIICLGDSIQIGGIPSGGDGTYTFQWSPTIGLSDPTAQNPMASPPYTVTYQLIVVSNGCPSDADYIKVIVEPRPTVALTPVMGPICAGDSVYLEALISNAVPPITYLWTPSTYLSDSTSPTTWAFPPTTTTYVLQVWGRGCITPSTDTVLVQVYPSPIIDADTTATPLEICRGESITLPAALDSNGIAPLYAYWNYTNGFLSPQDTQLLRPTVKPTETTVYYLWVEYGGCKLVDSTTVYVLEPVDLQWQTTDTLLCRGDSIAIQLFSPAPNVLYTWLSAPNVVYTTADSTFIIATPENDTLYKVFASTGKCRDSMQVNVRVLPIPQPSFQWSTTQGCDSITVSFLNTSQDSYVYLWDFGDGTFSNVEHPTHTYTQPGVYMVTLYAYGESRKCVDSALVALPIEIIPGPKAYFGPLANQVDTLQLPNATIQFIDSSQGAIRSWLWTFGDGHSSQEQHPIHTFEYPGSYIVTLRVEDTLGCTDAFQQRYYVVADADIYIPTVFTPNGDGINDFWQLRYEGEGFQWVQIFDRWGNKVFESTSSQARWDGKLSNGKPANEGVYFYAIKVQNKILRGHITLLR